MEDLFKSINLHITPEYIEECRQKSYRDDRACMENFSNWYPHIVDFGKFKHANIISNQIFTYNELKVLEQSDSIDDVDWNSINDILKPTLDKMEKYKIYNIKNGCFSNKFDFETSLVTTQNLAEQLWKINYQSSMYDTGGKTELVVREYINYDTLTTPTIYNGMPLREEIRVFYDIDKRKILYTVDYWDYNYCIRNILDKTDKIVFNWFHNKYGDRVEKHSEIMKNINKFIQDNIDTLKFDKDISGVWSIDFMKKDEEIYLIDMARGYRSAYWNPEYLK